MSNPEDAKHLQIEVASEATGTRLDRYLASHPEINTRSRAAHLIDLGNVSLRGARRPLKASYRVHVGDLLEVRLPLPEPSVLQPLHMPLEIVYEDADCLVVNKPAGLVVHPAAGHAQDTLVNALLAQVNNLSMGFGENRPGIVHRLDKDTSGLLVIAKNDFSHERLAIQFRNKTVLRTYWAIVYGQPKARERKIESLLARHPTQRKKFCSQAVGKRALTHYQTVRSKSGLSLLSCQLETGRTHQIRVHLSEAGHPIIGDQVYGNRRGAQDLGKELRQNVEAMQRIGLHACELGFIHPRSGDSVRFFADWPEDLTHIVAMLGFRDVSGSQI